MVGGHLFRFWPIVVIVARMNCRCRRAHNECMKRGIINKIYDKILLRRYSNWFRTTLSNQQGVAEKGGSSMNTALLLYEAFAHTENTYVALMYKNSLI